MSYKRYKLMVITNTPNTIGIGSSEQFKEERDHSDVIIEDGLMVKDTFHIFPIKSTPKPKTVDDKAETSEHFMETTEEGYKLQVRVETVYRQSPTYIKDVLVTDKFGEVTVGNDALIPTSSRLIEHGLQSRALCMSSAYFLQAMTPHIPLLFRLVKFSLKTRTEITRVEEEQEFATDVAK